MRNAKKTLSLVMVAIFTTFIVLSGIPAAAVTTAQAKAQVTKATAAVVKVETTVKVATFNPTTATTQVTAATKEVAKVKSLGKTYTATYTKLVARYQAVNKKITARKAVIAAALKAANELKALNADAEAAVEAAEKATDADAADLVNDETALGNAQGAVTAALEAIVKLDQNSANYKGLMARIDAVNNVVMKAMEEKAAIDAAKAAEEAAKKLAEEAAKALEAAIAAADKAVAAVEAAPVTTDAEITAAIELGKTAQAAIAAIKNPEKEAPLTARLTAAAAKGLAAVEAKKPATIAKFEAVDGTLTVTFNKTPLTTPAAASFAVTKAINGAAAVAVTPTAVATTGSVATLTVDKVAAVATTEQSVVYSVVYNATGAAVSATPVVIAKLPTLEVKSVAALNAKQVEVVFNKAVDATTAGTATNYTVGGVAFGTAAVQADNMTVILTLAGETKMTNAGTADIKVLKAIKDADGIALAADYAKTITITDMKLPSVVKVEATGLKTIKITFDEPVYDAVGDTTLENDQITVKSGIYTYTITSAVADYAKRTVTLTTGTALLAGDVVVKINAPGMTDVQSIRDFAGLTALTQEVTFKYAVDTTVATATLTSVSKETKTAKVTFSKPVYGANVVLYHSVNGAAAYGTAVLTKTEANAATEWEFTFTNALPAGALTFYLVNSATAADQLTDLFGVKIANQTFNYNVVADTVAPTVSTVTVNTNASIDIAFSEAADATELVNASNYSILKADGTSVSFTTSSVDSKTVRLTATLEDNTTVTVNVKAMKDAAGVAMAAAYSVQKTVSDNLNPTATVYATGTNTIYVSYSENMNESDITNKNNYLVDANDDGTYAALGTDDVVTLVSAKKVKITWAANDFTGGVDRVQIGSVRDLAGKKLTSDNVFVTSYDNVASDSLTFTASVVALNKVKLTFNKVITTFDNAEFTVVGSTVQQIESITTNSDGVSEVILVLDASLVAGVTPNVTTVATPANTKSTESTVLSGSQTVATVDKVAPTFTVEFINTSTIYVTFDKNIEADTVSTVGTNGFSVNGGTLTKAAMETPGADGKVIVLTSADANFTVNTDVTYTQGYISDNTVSFNKVATKTVTDAISSDANTKLRAFETAAALDLSVDANNTAAVTAKTAADTAITALAAGSVKTAFQTRATAASAYITASNTAEALVVTAETACATAVTTTDLTNINAAATALGLVAYTGTNAATQAGLTARYTAAKTSVANDSGFTFVVTQGADATHIKVTVAGTDVNDISTGYTVAITDSTTGLASTKVVATTAADMAATAITAAADGTADTNIVTYTYTFWSKSDTVTVSTSVANAVTVSAN